MQHNMNSLLGFKMGATDGEIGELKAFYFDDETWAIRYLVIETGSWFSNKKVLIAPQALLTTDWSHRDFPINLTKEQVKSCPDVDTDKPISYQQEIDMFGHYAWERYGGGGFYAGSSAAVMNLPPIVNEEIIRENRNDEREDFDPHLRSTTEVSGYHIHATDGDIGHVDDFTIDDETWTMTNLIIDTHNWIGSHKVLIPVRHVTEIRLSNITVMVDISMEYVKDCTVFDENSLYPPNAL